MAKKKGKKTTSKHKEYTLPELMDEMFPNVPPQEKKLGSESSLTRETFYDILNRVTRPVTTDEADKD